MCRLTKNTELGVLAPKTSQLLLKKSIYKQKWIFEKYNAIHLWFYVSTLLVPVDANTMPNMYCFVLGTDLFFYFRTHMTVQGATHTTTNHLGGESYKKKKTAIVLAMHS